MLVCSNVSRGGDRRRRARRRAAARAGRARRRARPADRLRGARLGPPRARLRPRVADRRGRPTTPRSAPAWTPSTSSRAARTRRASAAIPGEKIFFLQLADAPQLAHGRPAVEPPLPLLPRPGRLRPAGVPRARAAPPATPARCRWRSSTTSSAQADPRRMAVDAMRSLLVLEEAAGVTPLPPAAARRLRVRRARGRARRRAADVERLLDRAGLPPRRPAPQQAGAAVAPRRHPHPRQPRATAPAEAAGGRDRGRERGPARLGARAPSALLAPGAPARARARARRDLSAIAAPDGTSVFFCRTDAADGWLADFLTAGPPGAPAPAEVRGDRPRRALAAVRLLRRGGALLPLGARARARRRATSSRRPTGSSAAARRATPTARALRAQRRRCVGGDGDRAAARRARLRRRARRRPGDARARACRCCASPATTTTTSRRGPSSTRSAIESCASSAILYDRDDARRAPALLHRDGRRGLFFEVRRAPRRLRRLRRRQLARCAWRPSVRKVPPLWTRDPAGCDRARADGRDPQRARPRPRRGARGGGERSDAGRRSRRRACGSAARAIPTGASCVGRDDLDAVLICSPSAFHCEQIIAAAEAGQARVLREADRPRPGEHRRGARGRRAGGRHAAARVQPPLGPQLRGAAAAARGRRHRHAVAAAHHARDPAPPPAAYVRTLRRAVRGHDRPRLRHRPLPDGRGGGRGQRGRRGARGPEPARRSRTSTAPSRRCGSPPARSA